MSAPFTDKANPFTELGSEQPAADNVAVASSPAASGESPELRAGEVIPGDVAGYVVPGAQPVRRSAEQDVTPGSMTEGAESTSVATAANDSPIPATVAATSGAEIEARARERSQDVAPTYGGGGRIDGDDDLQPARGGVVAAERAAAMRGVGMPPTHAPEAAPGGGGGSGGESLRVEEREGGGGSSGGGGVGQTVSSMVKGLAGLMTGQRAGGKEASSGGGGGRDTSDTQ